MRQISPRSTTIRRLTLTSAAALATLAVAAPSLAGAETPATGKTDVVHIRMVKGLPQFVAPATVTEGDELEVVNDTNPKQIGPHTFSLVTKSSLPKTKKARQVCFTPHHICKAIASWHGVKGEGPPKYNPAEAGEEGWDTMGSLTAKGDSWFTGEKPHASIAQQVTAPATQTIYFMCAIHPWMHGKITVEPAG